MYKVSCCIRSAAPKLRALLNLLSPKEDAGSESRGRVAGWHTWGSPLVPACLNGRLFFFCEPHPHSWPASVAGVGVGAHVAASHV